jgi:hypothetical protein
VGSPEHGELTGILPLKQEWEGGTSLQPTTQERTMADLINKAVEISLNGGEMNDVWNALHAQYAQFGDPMEVHADVLDGADEKIREMFAMDTPDMF